MDMKKILFHLLIATFAATPAFAEDTVVFKNGDTLTGIILEQDAETMLFESEVLGSVSLNVREIAEIRTATEKLDEMVDSVETAAAPESAAPAPEPAPKAAAAPAPPPKKKNPWSGQAGLAIALREKTSSNSSGTYRTEQYETYSIYGNINWKGKKNGFKWSWNYRYSEDETKIRDNFFNITQKYNHNLKDGYYAEAKTVYQRDYNRNIDNEYLQTAEIGKKWFQRPKFKFSTSVGAGYHQYDRGDVSTRKPEFIFDESLEWKMINSLTLFQKYTHLGDFEKYHLIFTSGLENKLIRDVFLRLEYRLDRDTETSYDDKGYYDKVLLTSLLYKF